jgi:hypothetical protein
MGGAYMSEVVEEAKRRLAWHRQEVKRLEEWLGFYGELGRTNAEQDELWKQEPKETSAPVDKPVEMRRRRRMSGAKPREIVEIMQRVIRDRGQPMTRGEIVEALEARDVELPAADKQRYIGTIAWRHKAFFPHIEGRGYWVSGEPVKDWWRKAYAPTEHDPKHDVEE